MRSVLFAVIILCSLSACGTPSDTAKTEPLRTYDLTGEVISLDTSGQVKVAKIKHQAIGDWMGAMTMDFPVIESAQFAKLKPGEKVTGKVYVRGLTFWAGDFTVLPPDAPAEGK